MRSSQIYQEYEQLAEQMDIKFIVGKGQFNGGICILEDAQVIVLNKQKPIEQKIKKLTQIFSELDLSNIYIKPIIRELIDSERKLSFL